jgi:hypothetical protein
MSEFLIYASVVSLIWLAMLIAAPFVTAYRRMRAKERQHDLSGS